MHYAQQQKKTNFKLYAGSRLFELPSSGSNAVFRPYMNTVWEIHILAPQPGPGDAVFKYRTLPCLRFIHELAAGGKPT